MDDDYDDFFRQDISEGKDDDEDKDIPSVSPFLTNRDIFATFFSSLYKHTPNTEIKMWPKYLGL